MPSKTRGIKAAKALKENIVPKLNIKKANNVSRSRRRPLTDKTNSASDDNASILKSEKPMDNKSNKQVRTKCEQNVKRPKRERRLPNRYRENVILINLSNNNLSTSKQKSPIKKSPFSVKLQSPNKIEAVSEVSKNNINNLSPVEKVPYEVLLSPLKSPPGDLDRGLIKNRPRRVCAIKNKLGDQSVSVNKELKVKPVYASTPLISKTKKKKKENVNKSILSNQPELVTNVTTPMRVITKVVKQGSKGNNIKNLPTADSNNNAKQNDKPHCSPRKSQVKKTNTKSSTKQNLNRNDSIRLLDNKKKLLKRDSSGLDVYEFTYDPDEEPPPIKKKKKKTATKRPQKSKTVVKSSYDKNLAKALAALKQTVSAQSRTIENRKENNTLRAKKIYDDKYSKFENMNPHITQNMVKENKYNSIRLEDIALDMQPIVEEDNINYSPVNSPDHPGTPVNRSQQSNDADPLNLQDDISFFEDQPAASSSINTSARHPLASPWRVEFNNLPIKWQVNTYVKPNMTPAIESSFINSNDNKRKHVYTNMVTETNDSLPQIVTNVSDLKQTSIISFIKEVVEKSANKSKGKSTPVKAHSLFQDIENISVNKHKTKTQTPLKTININNSISNSEIAPDDSNRNDILDKKNLTEVANRDNIEKGTITKHLNKKSKKNDEYFGFDSIEDLENISPASKKNKTRSLRYRTRGILQEINEQKGPTRAAIPVVLKSKPVQSIVNKVYEELNPASEPPVFQEVAVAEDNTLIKELKTHDNLDNDDSQSIHLFEDIDMIHLYRHKPTRKSYSKAKKVTFRQKSVDYSNNSQVSKSDERNSSDEDNLDDLSFKLPSERPRKTIKKRKPKKQLSKKEEQEVEKWAAGFNSMCEDIDEFDLVVE